MWKPMFPAHRRRADRPRHERRAPRDLPRRSDVRAARAAPRRALAARARPTPRRGRPCAHIPNDELWRARTAARRRLAEFAQQKAEQDRLLRGEDIDYVRAGADLLDADTLTFGFARRLAGYKRLVAARRRPGARAQRCSRGPPADPGADRRQGAPARRDRQAPARAAVRAARRDRPGRRPRRLPRGLRPRARRGSSSRAATSGSTCRGRRSRRAGRAA